MKKLKATYVISLLIIISLSIAMLSCDRKGSLNEAKNPIIEITEYSGISKPDGVSDSTFFHTIGDSINPAIYDSIFRQTIYWNAYDEDGVVKSFAYRIGSWDSVNSEWLYDKAYGVEIDKSNENYGWVLHRQPNGDSLIWTSPDERFPRATVYFPSQDTSDFRNNFGKFEVKCIDDQGNVSNVATKYFCTYSAIPTTYITTSQGDIDSCRVGTAINFEFSVQDPDPYGYGAEAAYYKYRMARVPRIGAREDTLGKGFSGYEFSVGTEILGYVDNDSTWKSTQNNDDPHNLFLQLEANDINELTQLQVKAVDKAGITDPNYATTTFFVRDYFKPETRPFIGNTQPFLDVLPNIFLLGSNHYLTYLPTNVSVEIPQREVQGEIIYGTQYYYDLDTTLTAVWSDDLEINFQWEYFGQYMTRITAGKATRSFKGYTFAYDEDLPVTQIIGGEPQDPVIPPGYCSYYCDVTHMEIQLDDGVDNLPPLGEEITDTTTGEKWLRIPIENNQECRIVNHPGEIKLASGEHKFEVRARDLQGAVDPTPATINFKLPEKPAQKEDVLLVNNTPNQMFFSEVDSVNKFYGNLVEESFPLVLGSGKIDTIDILNSNNTIKNNNAAIGHSQATYFSYSDLLDYKAIVWHSNNRGKFYFNTSDNFKTHTDILTLYMDNGGNIIFSGGANLYDPQSASNKFLRDFAGFASNSYALNKSLSWKGSDDIYPNGVLAGAEGLNGFDFNMTIEDSLVLLPNNTYFPHSFIFGPLGGVGNATFFTLNGATPIFNGVPKESVANPENYDGYIASKYTKEPGKTGTAYILGFPLYYIEFDDALMFMNNVIDEIWNQ